MKIYYAHAMCIYGTDDEDTEMLQIKQNFPDHSIVDPGTYASNPDKRNGGMEYCMKLVSECDKLVFTRLLEKITAGVGLEINYALDSGKLVYELKKDKIKQVKKPVKYISRNDTISLYGKYRMKKSQLGFN
ncbi:MAG: hypothetical protein IIC67_11860 [Thaumarchaeota archaeon]|nr:hypothetical protein [Nitrososphaerota archaeon]